MLTIPTKPKYPVLNRANRTANVVSLYPFHEGAGMDIYDIGGNLNHGVAHTVLPQPQWQNPATLYQGETGSSLRLDGIRDRVDLPVVSCPSAGSFSIGFWFNPAILMDSGNTFDHYLFALHDDASTNGFSLKIKGNSSLGVDHTSGPGAISGGYLVAGIETTTTPSYISSNTALWSANIWYHVVMTYNAKTLVMRMYINGTLQTSSNTAVRGTALSTLCTIGDQTPSPIYVASAYAWAFPGLIDFVSVWDYELAQAEIALLYNDPYSILTGDVTPVTNVKTDFRLNRNQIIRKAYLKLGGIQIDDSPTSSRMYEDGADSLNLLVKHLQMEGFRLWTSDWIQFPYYQSAFVIGADGKNYTCSKSHQANPSNQPGLGSNWQSVWVTDDTSLQVAGAIPVSWADGEYYKASGNIELEESIIHVERMFYRMIRNDINISIINRYEYFDTIIDKAQFGTPRFAMFDQQLPKSMLRVWPQPGPAQSTQSIHALVIRKHPNLDNANDPLPFWDRWQNVLVYGLADQLADEVGLPLDERQNIERRYKMALQAGKGTDSEMTTSTFMRSAY
jgi:hypothetical protein